MNNSFNRMRKSRVCVGMMLAASLAVTIGGCVQPKAPANLPRLFTDLAFNPSVPGAFEIGPVSKYARYEKELAGYNGKLPSMANQDFAMLAANRSMIRLALGQIDGTISDALDAQAVMTGEVEGESGKAIAAAITDEGFKVFKGECYEIAMINSIVGLGNLAKGDSETAAIGFRRALEADKMSKEEGRDDFILAYWGLGMSFLDSDMNAARQALGRCGYKSADVISNDNMVFLISIGRAPYKMLGGLYGEYDSFMPSSYEPASAEVFVDGKSLGRSFKLVDLREQSRDVPRSGKDVGQGAKAVGKFALAIVAGAFLGDAGQDLVENAWSVKADTRVCYMMPNEMHVVSGKVSPGMHTVNVKFYNAGGAELKRYKQVWHYLAAPESGRRYVNIRSEFDRCNVQGPVAFTRISKVKTKKIKPEQQGAEPKKLTTVFFRNVNIPNVAVGDTITLCYFYRRTQNRWDNTYHWRYKPMAYNNKGEAIGYPNNRFRMQDYDVGVVGKAKIVEIDGETAAAEVISLTTDYRPQVDGMVTTTRRVGRLWK